MRHVSKFALFHGYGRRRFQTAKSDLQDHSRALAMEPFDRHIRFPVSVLLQLSLSCTVNEMMSLISQNLKGSRDSEHISVGGNRSVSCTHHHSSESIRNDI